MLYNQLLVLILGRDLQTAGNPLELEIPRIYSDVYCSTSGNDTGDLEFKK